MKKVTFVGTEQMPEYHGFDGDTPINLDHGDVAVVTPAKAEQLLDDFGDFFLEGEHDVDPIRVSSGDDADEDEAVRQAQEQADAEQAEAERVAAEQAEAERVAAEQAAVEALEALKAELEPLTVPALVEKAKAAGIEGAGKGALRTKPQLVAAIIEAQKA